MIAFQIHLFLITLPCSQFNDVLAFFFYTIHPIHSNQTPLLLAAENSQLNVVQFLLHQPDINPNAKTILIQNSIMKFTITSSHDILLISI